MKYIKVEDNSQVEIFDITIKGNTTIRNKIFPIIEGGFGENCKIVSDNTIADVHSMRVADIRRRICDNLKRFKEGVDYIDLKNCCALDTQQFGYTKMQESKAEHLFLLSERGYGKLIKIMDSDLAWEIYDDLLDNYFTMRETINSNERLKAMYLLKAVESNGEESVIAIKAYSDIRIKEETAPLIEDIKNKEVIIEEQKVEIKETKNELVNTSELLSGAIENMDVYKKKDIINRVIKRAGSGFAIQNRYNEIYKAYRETKHIDLPLRTKGYNMKQQKKKDHLSTIKYAEKFGHISDLYEVVCNLYSSDVKELLEELNETFKG